MSLNPSWRNIIERDKQNYEANMAATVMFSCSALPAWSGAVCLFIYSRGYRWMQSAIMRRTLCTCLQWKWISYFAHLFFHNPLNLGNKPTAVLLFRIWSVMTHTPLTMSLMSSGRLLRSVFTACNTSTFPSILICSRIWLAAQNSPLLEAPSLQRSSNGKVYHYYQYQ